MWRYILDCKDAPINQHVESVQLSIITSTRGKKKKELSIKFDFDIVLISYYLHLFILKDVGYNECFNLYSKVYKIKKKTCI